MTAVAYMGLGANGKPDRPPVARSGHDLIAWNRAAIEAGALLGACAIRSRQ
jgi:3-hydroxyisobutyrate dehydrogenase-like beta-hydroxyacid dehydrogenase